MAVYTDFSSLLAVATVLCGAIWAIDAWFFKPKRVANTPEDEMVPEPKVVDYARSFFPILLIVCILRSFIAEPFRIPTGSMKPTLLEGDFVLVNKFTYGVRLPIFGTKVISLGAPARGDIMVFRFPLDNSIDFIKRVIGVPGDKIRYENKVVYLNGKPLSQEFLGTVFASDQIGRQFQVRHLKETLPEKKHDIFLHVGSGGAMEEVTVPEGMYFVMGDNRDNSEDSRVWGFVSEDLILGKAFLIWMSWDPIAKDIRWNRVGKLIKE